MNKEVTFTNHNDTRRYYITRNRLYCWDKYKNIVPNSVKSDKICATKETVKIVLFENDKLKKLKMIAKGIHDYNKDRYGKI